MKIWVTGATGQLGHDVLEELQRRGIPCVGTGSAGVDITDKAAVCRFMEQEKPDAVIHCAAYTAVDRAEEEPVLCRRINRDGTQYIADACRDADAVMMYISTDYVFPGTGTVSYDTGNAPDPVNMYGETKWEGEKAVQQSLSRFFIVRISWVFGKNGNNFIKTMLRLGKTKKELNVVSDQVGSPTYTADIAPLLADMIQTDKYGLYHACNGGTCSWAELAREIFHEAGMETEVHPISTDEYPTKAKRPRNSRLSRRSLEEAEFELPEPWQDAVRKYIHGDLRL